MIVRSLLLEFPEVTVSELYHKHLSTNPPNTATLVSMDSTHMTQEIVEASVELIDLIKADADMEIISES